MLLPSLHHLLPSLRHLLQREAKGSKDWKAHNIISRSHQLRLRLLQLLQKRRPLKLLSSQSQNQRKLSNQRARRERRILLTSNLSQNKRHQQLSQPPSQPRNLPSKSHPQPRKRRNLPHQALAPQTNRVKRKKRRRLAKLRPTSKRD